ncbi:MAG: hypothetical protein FRX49_04431 [Trebouxia sp. A1-2]|nr:MAG: hypothetical protein FRX49_04431 [Trebouxia sp. A1-2]
MRVLPVAACGAAGAAFDWALSCPLIASKGEMAALEASVCRDEEALLVLLAPLDLLDQCDEAVSGQELDLMPGFSDSDGPKLQGLLALCSSCKGIGSESGSSAARLTDFGLGTGCLPATLMPTGCALMCEEKGRPAFAAASRALAVAARVEGSDMWFCAYWKEAGGDCGGGEGRRGPGIQPALLARSIHCFLIDSQPGSDAV